MSSETLFAQTAHRAYAASVAAFVPTHRLDVPRPSVRGSAKT